MLGANTWLTVRSSFSQMHQQLCNLSELLVLQLELFVCLFIHFLFLFLLCVTVVLCEGFIHLFSDLHAWLKGYCIIYSV